MAGLGLEPSASEDLRHIRPRSRGLPAKRLRRQGSCADLAHIRQAIEYDLDDIEDLCCGVAALKDPADPVLDWAEVRVAAGFSRSE